MPDDPLLSTFAIARWAAAVPATEVYEIAYRLRQPRGGDRHLTRGEPPILPVDGSSCGSSDTCRFVAERRDAEAALRAALEQLKRHSALVEAEVVDRTEALHASESLVRGVLYSLTLNDDHRYAAARPHLAPPAIFPSRGRPS